MGAFNRPKWTSHHLCLRMIRDITSAHFWELMLLLCACLPAVDEEHAEWVSSYDRDGGGVMQN